MDYISGAGLSITLVASVTFPNGITLTQFADDTDPLDFPDATIAEYGIGLNGHMVIWQKAIPLQINLSIIPSSTDDANLSILWEANRQKKNSNSVKDVISMSVNYPDGTVKSLVSGAILTGAPIKSVQQNGRYKTKTFGFIFENQN